MTLTSASIDPPRGGDRHTFAEMCSIVNALAEAKNRQDVEAALAVYHTDAILESPPFRARRAGTEQLRVGLNSFFEMVPDYAVELPHLVADGDTLCGWGAISFTLSHTFNDAIPNGRRVSTPVFILSRFKERRVIWESFHFDLSDVAEQSGVPTESLIRRPQNKSASVQS